MREKALEQKLVRMVRGQDGIAFKFVSPGMAGGPDRLVLLPGGRAVFCELKAPGKAPRALQQRRIKQLRALGFKVYVVECEEQIEALIRDVIPNKAEALNRDVILSKAEGRVEGSPPAGNIPIERSNP